MWAVKVKGRNIYLGVCVIPQPMGLTFSRFPGNDVYWPKKFGTEGEAREAADAVTKNEANLVGDVWEVVPYPTSEVPA